MGSLIACRISAAVISADEPVKVSAKLFVKWRLLLTTILQLPLLIFRQIAVLKPSAIVALALEMAECRTAIRHVDIDPALTKATPSNITVLVTAPAVSELLTPFQPIGIGNRKQMVRCNQANMTLYIRGLDSSLKWSESGHDETESDLLRVSNLIRTVLTCR